MARGLDRVFLHYGVRHEDMDIIEQFIETFNNKQKTKNYYLISEKYYDVKNVHKDREPQKII